MRSLLQYILDTNIHEDFKLKKKAKISPTAKDTSIVVDDIIHYLEIDKLATEDNPYKRIFISPDELINIKEQLIKFFDNNDFTNVDSEKFVYTANDNRKSEIKDSKIAERFNYNSSKLGSIIMKLGGDSSRVIFYNNHKGLRIEASSVERVIGVGGPFGGYKSCEF